MGLGLSRQGGLTLSDPKPRGRLKDPGLLKVFARRPCQITGLQAGAYPRVETHHLSKHPRHDETGNLFRIIQPLHGEYEGGTRRMAVAALMRAYMTSEQEEHLASEKGRAWLDLNYPSVDELIDGCGQLSSGLGKS